MEDYKIEFYKQEIEKIKNFLIDENKILYVEKEGNANYEFISEAFSQEKDKFMFFKYHCSDFSVIEDIMLNLYDTLRNFSISKRLSLKKSTEEDFVKKVITYIREIECDVLIVIENFEKILNKKQIIGFLESVIQCNNTKIIFYTKDKFFDNPYGDLLPQTIFVTLPRIIKEKTIDIVLKNLPNENNETIEKLYKYSDGNDFSFFESINYANITNIRVKDLINEFEKRNLNYETFIMNKMLSLAPNTYSDILKIMSIISQPVSQKFLLEYELANTEQINYLIVKDIIIETEKNLILKEHYKKYFKNNFTPGEKVELTNQIIEIFKNEITKKPQDRLLRLSREGLRAQIEILKDGLPQIRQSLSQILNLNLNDQKNNFKAPWINADKIKNVTDADSDDNLSLLEKLKEYKFQDLSKLMKRNNENEKKELLELIQKAEDNFQYSEALSLLHNLYSRSQNDDINTKNEIDERIAQNLINSGKNEEAIIYYSRIRDNLQNEGNYEKTALFELKIARIYQNLYNVESARKICQKIINSTDKINNDDIISQAYYRLGSIAELENKEEQALENLKIAYTKAKNADNAETLQKITFTMANLFNKQNDNTSAKEYYLENIKLSEKIKSKNIGISYMNLATIFYNEEDDENAIKYFELAIKEYKNNERDNYSGLYYASKNMARIYKNIDNEKCRQYLEEEFYYAKALNDNFKIINSVVELGDYFYDTSQDTKALVYYIYAKNTLNQTNASNLNQAMINARIEDMRLKMPRDIFEGILIQHANDTARSI